MLIFVPYFTGCEHTE